MEWSPNPLGGNEKYDGRGDFGTNSDICRGEGGEVIGVE